VIPNGVGGSRQFRQIGKKKFARCSSLFFFPFSIRRKNYWRNWRDFVSPCGERAEARQLSGGVLAEVAGLGVCFSCGGGKF